MYILLFPFCAIFFSLGLYGVVHKWLDVEMMMIDEASPMLVWSIEADSHFLGLLQGFFREHQSLGKIDTHTWKMWAEDMSRISP